MSAPSCLSCTYYDHTGLAKKSDDGPYPSVAACLRTRKTPAIGLVASHFWCGDYRAVNAEESPATWLRNMLVEYGLVVAAPVGYVDNLGKLVGYHVPEEDYLGAVLATAPYFLVVEGTRLHYLHEETVAAIREAGFHVWRELCSASLTPNATDAIILTRENSAGTVLMADQTEGLEHRLIVQMPASLNTKTFLLR